MPPTEIVTGAPSSGKASVGTPSGVSGTVNLGDLGTPNHGIVSIETGRQDGEYAIFEKLTSLVRSPELTEQTIHRRMPNNSSPATPLSPSKDWDFVRSVSFGRQFHRWVELQIDLLLAASSPSSTLRTAITSPNVASVDPQPIKVNLINSPSRISPLTQDVNSPANHSLASRLSGVATEGPRILKTTPMKTVKVSHPGGSLAEHTTKGSSSATKTTFPSSSSTMVGPTRGNSNVTREKISQLDARLGGTTQLKTGSVQRLSHLDARIAGGTETTNSISEPKDSTSQVNLTSLSQNKNRKLVTVIKPRTEETVTNTSTFSDVPPPEAHVEINLPTPMPLKVLSSTKENEVNSSIERMVTLYASLAIQQRIHLVSAVRLLSKLLRLKDINVTSVSPTDNISFTTPTALHGTTRYFVRDHSSPKASKDETETETNSAHVLMVTGSHALVFLRQFIERAVILVSSLGSDLVSSIVRHPLLRRSTWPIRDKLVAILDQESTLLTRINSNGHDVVTSTSSSTFSLESELRRLGETFMAPFRPEESIISFFRNEERILLTEREKIYDQFAELNDNFSRAWGSDNFSLPSFRSKMLRVAPSVLSSNTVNLSWFAHLFLEMLSYHYLRPRTRSQSVRSTPVAPINPTSSKPTNIQTELPPAFDFDGPLCFFSQFLTTINNSLFHQLLLAHALQEVKSLLAFGSKRSSGSTSNQFQQTTLGGASPQGNGNVNGKEANGSSSGTRKHLLFDLDSSEINGDVYTLLVLLLRLLGRLLGILHFHPLYVSDCQLPVAAVMPPPLPLAGLLDDAIAGGSLSLFMPFLVQVFHPAREIVEQNSAVSEAYRPIWQKLYSLQLSDSLSLCATPLPSNAVYAVAEIQRLWEKLGHPIRLGLSPTPINIAVGVGRSRPVDTDSDNNDQNRGVHEEHEQFTLDNTNFAFSVTFLTYALPETTFDRSVDQGSLSKGIVSNTVTRLEDSPRTEVSGGVLSAMVSPIILPCALPSPSTDLDHGDSLHTSNTTTPMKSHYPPTPDFTPTQFSSTTAAILTLSPPSDCPHAISSPPSSPSLSLSSSPSPSRNVKTLSSPISSSHQQDLSLSTISGSPRLVKTPIRELSPRLGYNIYGLLDYNSVNPTLGHLSHVHLPPQPSANGSAGHPSIVDSSGSHLPDHLSSSLSLGVSPILSTMENEFWQRNSNLEPVHRFISSQVTRAAHGRAFGIVATYVHTLNARLSTLVKNQDPSVENFFSSLNDIMEEITREVLSEGELMIKDLITKAIGQLEGLYALHAAPAMVLRLAQYFTTSHLEAQRHTLVTHLEALATRKFAQVRDLQVNRVLPDSVLKQTYQNSKTPSKEQDIRTTITSEDNTYYHHQLDVEDHYRQVIELFQQFEELKVIGYEEDCTGNLSPIFFFLSPLSISHSGEDSLLGDGSGFFTESIPPEAIHEAIESILPYLLSSLSTLLLLITPFATNHTLITYHLNEQTQSNKPEMRFLSQLLCDVTLELPRLLWNFIVQTDKFLQQLSENRPMMGAMDERRGRATVQLSIFMSTSLPYLLLCDVSRAEKYFLSNDNSATEHVSVVLLNSKLNNDWWQSPISPSGDSIPYAVDVIGEAINRKLLSYDAIQRACRIQLRDKSIGALQHVRCLKDYSIRYPIAFLFLAGRLSWLHQQSHMECSQEHDNSRESVFWYHQPAQITVVETVLGSDWQTMVQELLIIIDNNSTN